LSHLSRSLSVHLHHQSISLVPSVPLNFRSQPTTNPFHLSHLSRSISVHLPPPVHFSCPICPPHFQFTTHLHSLSNTNPAAPLCTILFIPPLIPLTSDQISPSAPVLAQYFLVYSLEHKHKHTTLNTPNSV
jgi:hypothetical protein